MALLNKGNLTFQGPPDELINKARGHVFRIEAFDSDLEIIKEKYPVISTIPSENGWEVEVVADTLNDYSATEIDPNLEHAYIYYMEYLLEETAQVS